MARRGLTPDRVTEAGAELADEIGFEQVTPAELARRLEVRSASLYSHVASAADLRSRIAAFALNELADRVNQQMLGRAGRDALAAMADAYREYAHAHPGRFAASTWQPGADDRLLAAGVRHHALAVAALRDYGLPADDVPHAIRLLGSTIRGFITLEASGSLDHSAPPAAETWPYVTAALDALLRRWPEISPSPTEDTHAR